MAVTLARTQREDELRLLLSAQPLGQRREELLVELLALLTQGAQLGDSGIAEFH